METMKKTLEHLQAFGFEVLDNRHLQMGFSIAKQPEMKYVSISKKDNTFFVVTVGQTLTKTQVHQFIAELMKANDMVSMINNAIEKGL